MGTMTMRQAVEIEMIRRRLDDDDEWLCDHPQPSRPIEVGEILWPNSKGKHTGVVGPVVVVGLHEEPREYDVLHQGELLRWSARQLEAHTKMWEKGP